MTPDEYEEEYVPDPVDEEAYESGTDAHTAEETGNGYDYEAEARKQGWRPRDEFSGGDDDWVDAKTFVERGNTNPRILQSRVEKLDRALQEKDRKLQEMQETYDKRLQNVSKMTEYALQQQRKNLESQFAAVKRQAVQVGDEELYDKVEQQEQQTRQQWAKEDEARQQDRDEPKKRDDQPTSPPEVEAWKARNTWFEKDRTLTDEAVAYESYLAQARPGMTVEERLEATREHVVRQFPQKFGKKEKQTMSEERRRGSPVESGQRSAGSAKQNDAGFSKLPAEAKDQFNSFVKEGLFKDDVSSRAEYAKHYSDGLADLKN
jgi:hypothetical protein